MEETLTLFDNIYDEIASCLKHSSNGITCKTDLESKKRTELALEIASGVMEIVEKYNNPEKLISAQEYVPFKHVEHYFKSNDGGKIWATGKTEIMAYCVVDGGLQALNETDIFGTPDNLADCWDIIEISELEFAKILKEMKVPS